MKILFFGCRQGGHDCLKYLLDNKKEVVGVVTRDDRKDEIRHGDSVIELAFDKENRQHVLTPNSTNDETLIREVQRLQPDIILSVFYDKKISPEVLKVVKKAINFHGAPLPKYKGCYTNMWGIINGEEIFGVTAHYMDEKLDNGDIVAINKFEIKPEDNGFTTYMKSTEETVKLFKFIFEILDNGGEMKGTPQKPNGTYYRKELPYKGIIDISWPPRMIHNFVRAFVFPPFPPAYIPVGGKKLYVTDTEICGNELKIKDAKLI